MTITEFLLARFAEDEQDAHYWRTTRRTHYDRVIDDCVAKRRIVELAEEATGLDMQVDSGFRVGRRDEKAEPYLGDVMLRALASVYDVHPDFDESWRA